MRTLSLAAAALALLCAAPMAPAQQPAAQPSPTQQDATQQDATQQDNAQQETAQQDTARQNRARQRRAGGAERQRGGDGNAAARPMFNGTDLSGWRGRQDLWSVQDGAITGKTTVENPIAGNTFLIWEGGKPRNFQLTCQFKIEGGNSGIQYRSKVVDEANYVVAGYQADIDHDGRYAGINYEEKGRGILAQRGQRVTLLPEKQKEVETFGDATEIGTVIRQGEWNTYRIVAQGNRLRHYINDTLTCEVIDRDPEARSRAGVIALQLHRGPAMQVQFKDLMLQVRKNQNDQPNNP